MEYPKVEFFTKHAKLEAGREQTVDVLIRITPPATSGKTKSLLEKAIHRLRRLRG